MTSKYKLVAIGVMVLILVGCGNSKIRNRSNDYLYSKEIAAMTLPEGKEDAAIGELYIIPDIPIATVSTTTFNVPRPQPLSHSLLEESVKIESFNGERWIAINKPPAEVWPRLRNILTRSSVPTARTDAPNGILETGWLQFKDDGQHSHRFRFNIVSGVGVKSTEIKMIQMQADIGQENTVGSWPENSISSSREQEFMEVVANALISDINSGSVSLLAQNIGGDPRIEVIVPSGQAPYMAMNLDYGRAWVSVLDSLSLGGFSVVDKNQSGGTILVDFNDTPVAADDDTLFGLISSFLASDDGKAIKTLEYQVLLIEGEKGIEVRITDRNNKDLDTLLATKLLKVIRGNLS